MTLTHCRLFLPAIGLLLALAGGPLHANDKSPPWPSGEKVRLNLNRGNFEVLLYPAKLDNAGASPKALIIFGTGSSGWSYWEEAVCCRLQADGYEILGIDFALYSQHDYDLNILSIDCSVVV